MVAHHGWEIFGGEGFCADLCCRGPLLMESTVCDHHIHVFWLESKMAADGHIFYVVANIFLIFWNILTNLLCEYTNLGPRNSNQALLLMPKF